MEPLPHLQQLVDTIADALTHATGRQPPPDLDRWCTEATALAGELGFPQAPLRGQGNVTPAWNQRNAIRYWHFDDGAQAMSYRVEFPIGSGTCREAMLPGEPAAIERWRARWQRTLARASEAGTDTPPPPPPPTAQTNRRKLTTAEERTWSQFNEVIQAHPAAAGDAPGNVYEAAKRLAAREGSDIAERETWCRYLRTARAHYAPADYPDNPD